MVHLCFVDVLLRRLRKCPRWESNPHDKCELLKKRSCQTARRHRFLKLIVTDPGLLTECRSLSTFVVSTRPAFAGAVAAALQAL